MRAVHDLRCQNAAAYDPIGGNPEPALHVTRYSEAARLLAACLAEKVLMPEPMGNEVAEGRDYIFLGLYPQDAKAHAVYKKF